MAKAFLTPIDLNKNELLNLRLQNLAADPSSPVLGQAYYNTTANEVRWWDGTVWQVAKGSTPGANSIGASQIIDGSVTDTEIAAANKDGAAGTASMRTLGTGAQQAAAGNDSRLSDTRTPSTGSVVNASVSASAAIALSKLAVDPLARANHTGTQTSGTISDFDTQVRTSRLDQLAVPTAAVSMNSQRITNQADPVNPQDSATKNYVDTAVQGLDAKPSVRAASTGALTLSGTQTVDGVTLIAGDRILVKDQAAPATNGLYVVAAGAWSRTTDMDAWAEVPGTFVFVEQGTVNGDSGWLSTADQSGTLGTTAITWVQFSGAGQITAGAGLTKTGNQLDVGAGTGISVAADSVGIDTAVVARKYTQLIGNGALTSIAVTHSLGNQFVVALAYDATTLAQIECDVVLTSSTVTTFSFSVAPASNAIRVVIIG